MKIYFIRHGEPGPMGPDGRNLTELGQKQAHAAAQRLKDSGIEMIFSSPMIRAKQTAEPTAQLLGLNIAFCDFIKEIGWSSLNSESIPENGHPWKLARLRASEGKSLFMDDWQRDYPYSNSEVVQYYNNVASGIDEFLREFGYKREGDYYRVIGKDTEKTIAIFSHAGSSSAALSHILNIPFPQFCGAFCPKHASVTLVEFSNKAGELIYPTMLLFNDTRHTEDLTSVNTFIEK